MGCGKALGKDGLWEGIWVRMGCGKALGKDGLWEGIE